MVLSIFLSVRNTKTVSHVLYVTCPKEWIGFGNKCFYFSEDARNWTFSQTFCTSLEAGLGQFETKEELNFLKRYKGPSDHWIGLRRESSLHVWKWTDSTEYNASYVFSLLFLLLCLHVVMCGRCAYGKINLIAWKAYCSMRCKIEILCMLFHLLAVPLETLIVISIGILA
nr:C-type lectin domain family 2 member D isoform X3 [Globicephala melas]XP_060162776.1 C-type lectin domain family 2 member D isoform X3 [Globicephala melas]